MTTDFEMIQGDTRYIRYECTNENGAPIDLTTAASIKWGFVRYGDFNYNTIISKSLGSGISIEGTNVAVVKLNPADTATLSGKFEQTLRLEDFTLSVFSKNSLFVIAKSAI